MRPHAHRAALALTALGAVAASAVAASAVAASAVAASAVAASAVASDPIAADAETLPSIARQSEPATAPSEESAFDRACSALDARSIAADLEFLCDPALGGRGTATPEGELAARYVEARVRRLGLEPGSTDGYRPRFALVRQRLVEADSSIEVTLEGRTATLRLGRDAFLRGLGDLVTIDARGPLVGVGDGGRRELEQAGDLSGAWALLLDRGRGSAGAVRRALAAGARGVAVTPGPEYDREPYADRYAATTRALVEGRLSSPLARAPEASEGDSEARAVLALPRASVASWAELAGLALEELTSPGRRAGLRLQERRAVDVVAESSPNVAALLRGADPERAGELIVLCAHLDHLGTRDGEVYPGADDNASGSVGLLALAEALVARGPLDRSILFLWVTGEESGLWGSAAWCDDPRLPTGVTPVAAFNLDMIGRDDPEELWLTPTAKHPEHNALAAMVPELAPLEGFTNVVSQDSYWAASDHFSFSSRLRLPVVYLSSGEHDQYHRPTDTANRIDLDKLLRILRLHLRLLERTQALELRAPAGD